MAESFVVPRFSSLSRIFSAVALAAIGGASSVIHAADTWVGNSSNGSWEASGNWNGGTVPNTSIQAAFAANGSFAPTVNASDSVGEILLGGTFSQSFGGTGTLSIYSPTSWDYTAIANNSAQTITFNTKLATSSTSGNGNYIATTSTGGLIFNGTIAINGANLDLIAQSGTTIALNGVVTGALQIGNSSYYTGPSNGTGTTVLTSAYTYSEALSVSSGTLQLGNGGTTGSTTDNIAVSSGAALTFDLTNLSTYGGVVSGAGTLTQMGSGTLVLTGANTYTGGTTISAGLLQIGAGGTVGSITGNVTDNAALAFNRSNATTFVGVISGTGSLSQNGSGTLTLTGANTYTGATNVNSGTLATGATNAIGTTSAVTVASSATLAVNNTTTVGSLAGAGSVTLGGALTTGDKNTTTTFSGVISGTNGLTQNGTGTLVLSGANTYTGGTTISAGTLQIGAGGTSGSITGNVVDNATLAYNLSSATTYAGVVSGTGAFNQVGTGTTVLTGANTYSGGTTIKSGVIMLDSTTAGGAMGTLGTGTAPITLAGGGLGFNPGSTSTVYTYANPINVTASSTIAQDDGVLYLNGAMSLSSGATLTVGTAGWAGKNLFLGGAITGSGNLLVEANGLTLDNYSTGAGGAVYLDNVGNTYNGSTTIFNGSLIVAMNNATSQNSAMIIDSGATFNVNNMTSTVASISGAGIITLGAGALTSGNSTSTTFSGVISGTGSFTEAGTGTLTLTGANTYTGGTTVSAGTLQIGAGGTAGSITGNVTDNATLAYNQTDLNTFSGVVSGTGAFNQVGTGTTVLTGANTYTGGTTISAGELEIGAGGTTGSITGNVTDNATLAYNLSSATTYAGTISGTGALNQVGTGTTVLTGTNSYAGGTTISSGELIAASASALGSSAGNVTVASGGTLGLSGGINVVGQTGTLFLAGTGVGGTAGALANVSGNNSYEGNIQLSGNATITAGANLLYLGVGSPTYLTAPNIINLNGNTLTFNATSTTTVAPTYELYGGYNYDPTNILINSDINGTGGIAKTGAGTVTLLTVNSNNYTGSTVVTGGTLIVDGNESEPVISGSSLLIGNSVSPGSANSVVVQMGELASPEGGNAPSYIIGVYANGNPALGGVPLSSTSLTVYQDGLLNMNGASNGFSGITMQGGDINEGTATPSLYVGTGGITTNASSQMAQIQNGNLGMYANAFDFNIATGTTSNGYDLEVSSVVQNGTGFTNGNASDALVKTGTGTLVFTNANTYQGVTDIENGVLNIQNNSALGQTSSFQSLSNGTVVENGAQLQLANNITVASGETLSLNGSGISTTGALLNVSGNNTYNGFIYLDSNSRIDANAGTTLTIANTSGVNNGIMNGSSAGMNLSVGGAGTVVVNGGIDSDVNNIVKDGTGTVVIAGADSYVGATSVTAGVAQVTNNNGLSGTGAIVSSGATLQFAENASNANLNENSTVSTINGTGVSNNGAIENLNGDNSYSGNVVLGSAARINADSGSVLTMTGTITGAAENLTVGGAGNTNFVGVIGTTTGTLTKDGTGTATLSNVETYTGLTTVSNGVLAMNGNSVLGTTNVINIASTGTTVGGVGSSGTIYTNSLGAVTSNGYTYGTLSIGNNTDTVSMITGNGLVSFGTSAASSQLTLVGTGTFSGAFNGTGTLILAAGANFTLGNNFDDPNLNIVLDAGATLNVLGTNSIFGTLTVDGNATLNFSPTLTSVVEFNGTASPSGGGVNIVGGATLSVTNWVNTIDYFDSAKEPGNGRFNEPLNQIVFDSPTWSGVNTTWNDYANGPGGDPDNQITPVPEPSFYGAIAVAIALGVAVAYTVRRRRRQLAR